jgi:hypothetical protein
MMDVVFLLESTVRPVFQRLRLYLQSFMPEESSAVVDTRYLVVFMVLVLLLLMPFQIGLK